jgi:hypothetical protein
MNKEQLGPKNVFYLENQNGYKDYFKARERNVERIEVFNEGGESEWLKLLEEVEIDNDRYLILAGGSEEDENYREIIFRAEVDEYGVDILEEPDEYEIDIVIDFLEKEREMRLAKAKELKNVRYLFGHEPVDKE